MLSVPSTSTVVFRARLFAFRSSIMEYKLCSNCHLLKPETEFHKTRKDTDGLRNACKACTNAQNRAKYYRNSQSRITQIKQYHLEHPEQVRETQKRYADRHPDRRKATYRKYRQTHADQVRAYGRTEKSRQAVRRCRRAKPDQYRETARQ